MSVERVGKHKGGWVGMKYGMSDCSEYQQKVKMDLHFCCEPSKLVTIYPEQPDAIHLKKGKHIYNMSLTSL